MVVQIDFELRVFDHNLDMEDVCVGLLAAMLADLGRMGEGQRRRAKKGGGESENLIFMSILLSS